jgi:hypothetical protein
MKEKIYGAEINTQALIMYKADGSTIELKQGDIRLPAALEETKKLAVLPFGSYVEVELQSDNTFKEYEEKTGGLTKFFRVAKKALAGLGRALGWDDNKLGETTKVGLNHAPEAAELEPVKAAQDQQPAQAQEPTPVVQEPDPVEKKAKIDAAISDIMQHAVPASSEKFSDDVEGTKDTIIAVKDGAIIPNVQHLKPQIAHANATGDNKGVEKLLERIGKMTEKRSYDVKDLLKFLSKGDLPIADDGSILIYKILRRKGDHYVDCHTRKVPQKIGSYVCMDVKLVDPNRRNECSNGLHVARRQYLGGFGGDVCTLCKLEPEDVIALPSEDANKMRVCGYHILHELSDADFEKLRANQPFVDSSETKKILARALLGDHIPRLEEVRITEQQGGGVKIKPLATVEKVEVKAEVVAQKAETTFALSETIASAPVDPKKVVKEVTEAKASRKDQAQALWDTFAASSTATNAKALLDFKKSAKVGWDKLGISQSEADSLNGVLNAGSSKETEHLLKSPKNAKRLEQSAKQFSNMNLLIKDKAKKAPKPAAKPSKVKPKEKSMNQEAKAPVAAPRRDSTNKLSPKEEIAQLMKLDIREQARNILAVKQKSKKSWEVLGVPNEVVQRILTITKK